eukprot:1004833-Amphidinium_carterae.1
MQEPLLQSHGGSAEEPKVPAGVTLASHPIDVVREQFQRWWSTTTDKRYLRSEMTLRYRWSSFLPLVAFASFAVDVTAAIGGTTSWMQPACDIVLLLILCIASSRSDLRATLCVDYFWVALFLIGLQSGMQHTPVNYLVMVVFLRLCGFHTSVAPAVCIACIKSVLDCGSLAEGFPVTVATAFVAAGSMGSEFSLASLYLELHRERECNALLLDGATDGFGVVDSSTGRVL